MEPITRQFNLSFERKTETERETHKENDCPLIKLWIEFNRWKLLVIILCGSFPSLPFPSSIKRNPFKGVLLHLSSPVSHRIHPKSHCSCTAIHHRKNCCPGFKYCYAFTTCHAVTRISSMPSRIFNIKLQPYIGSELGGGGTYSRYVYLLLHKIPLCRQWTVKSERNQKFNCTFQWLLISFFFFFSLCICWLPPDSINASSSTFRINRQINQLRTAHVIITGYASSCCC